MAAVTVLSDFGAQEEEICHYFYFLPHYSPWSNGARWHDLRVFCFFVFFSPIYSFKPALSLSSFTLSRGSLVPFHFLSLEWYHPHIWGCWCFSHLSSFQLIQPGISRDVLSIQIKQTGRQQTALLYSFLVLEPISCSIQGSSCCFMTSIQVFQETGKIFPSLYNLSWSTQSKALMQSMKQR